jgi:cyclically-permuted mutarotase family protein
MKQANFYLLFLLLLSLSLSATFNAAAVTKDVDIVWQKTGELPAPEGFTESIGVSGAYSAFLGDYLIVAGGANFPKGHPFFDQGKKQYYSDIFVFDVSSAQMNLVARGHLPIKAGHGAAVVVDNSIYLVGGKNNELAFDSIIKLTLDKNKKPITEVIGKLPFSWDSGGAAWQNNALYVFAGKQNGQVSNQVCKYSFNSQTCIDNQHTPSVPGLNRSDFPSVHYKEQFYIFGGLNLAAGKDNFALTDVHRFNFNASQWQTLAPITVDKKPFSVAGGSVASINNNQLVLLGGVNRKVFNNAILQLTTLKGKALAEFKQHYFTLTKEEINFSRHQVIYDMDGNSWHTLTDKVPFIGGAGPLTVSQKGNEIYWISGEVKPVIRSPNIYLGNVVNKP